MASKKAGIIAGLAVAGVATVGMLASSAAAFADPSAPPSPGAAASAPANGAPSGKAARGQDGQAGQSGQAGRPDRGGQRGGASQDTPVTGDEAQKVIDAVKAKNADVTITEVRKDPDGTYDALGTKADGTKVMFDVSTDLQTITEGMGGAGKGGPGGKGGGQDTPVTGDEAQKVIDAVKAKNAGVTITTVQKDPDGTYDALGTKADGTKVMYDVSTDLQTITEGGKR